MQKKAHVITITQIVNDHGEIATKTVCEYIKEELQSFCFPDKPIKDIEEWLKETCDTKLLQLTSFVVKLDDKAASDAAINMLTHLEERIRSGIEMFRKLDEYKTLLEYVKNNTEPLLFLNFYFDANFFVVLTVYPKE